MLPASSFASVDLEILKNTVFDVTGTNVATIDLLGRDEFRRNFIIQLEDDKTVLGCVLGTNSPVNVIESEVATMRYIRDRTSIPVPRVLAFETDAAHPLGPHILMEKTPGVCLETVFPGLAPFEQDKVVAQIAKWTVELFHQHFDAIGSIYADTGNGYVIGPILRAPFYVDGRAKLALDRGPFNSTRSYLLACAQREIDFSRALFAQDTSLDYQRNLEECRLQVERSMGLLSDLICKCQGLDEDDPELAPFSIDLHELGLKNFYVSKDDPSSIISVVGWDCVSTKPLWQCARRPRWLLSSLSDEDDGEKVRLSSIYRHAVVTADGPDSVFVRALDSEDTRASLIDLCDYDAFKDGFLLQPTLESIAATLPGEEDVEGLSALLDPSTVTGRAARISLVTTGSAGDALSLAFSGTDDVNGRRPSQDHPRLLRVFSG